MNLHKASAHVLLQLIAGCVSAAQVAERLPTLELRTIQRAIARLAELGIVQRSGPDNDPRYVVAYDRLLATAIPDRLLEDPQRPNSRFNHEFVDWLKQHPDHALDGLAGLLPDAPPEAAEPLSPKELEYLTVELSWKSSALEGNTYTLLDTQLLLVDGIRPSNRTSFETQMILNHKRAIEFITQHRNLFQGDITFATVDELHRIIGDNLGIDPRVRRHQVRISASNYLPLGTESQLRESAGCVLAVLRQTEQPVQRSLLALALIPYLQLFEDGNKRTGRMLANGILLSTINRGFSLRHVPARELALAYLAFYEFNSIRGLAHILAAELNRS